MTKKIKRLHSLLEQERENLLAIRERMAKYVLRTDIPLYLETEEREKIAQIAQLEAELKQAADVILPPAGKPLARLSPIWLTVAALIGLVTLGVALGAKSLRGVGWLLHSTPTPMATASPTATFTPTSLSTATATPTEHATASPTPTPSPIPTLIGRQPINAETAARIASIEPPLVEGLGPISAIVFADDGAMYATGLITKTLQPWLWRMDPATVPITLTGKSLDRAGVAFSPDGRKLAWSIEPGDLIAVWDTAGATEPNIVRPWVENDQRFVGARVLSLAFSADGLTLACGTDKGRIALVRLDGSSPPSGLFYEPGHFVEVLSVAFGAEDETSGLSLASVLGWRVRQWMIQSPTMQEVSRRDISLKREGASAVPPVLNLVFSPKGDVLAAVGQPNGGVQTWTMGDWSPQRWLTEDISSPGVPRPHTFVRPLLPGETPQLPDSYPDGVPRGDNVKFSPDGSVIASWIKGNMIRLWRASDGQILKDTQPLSSGISSLAFSRDGVLLAAGASDGKVYQWRVQHEAR